MITEFVAYVTRNDVSIKAKIQPSTYKTHSFLLKKQAHLEQDYNNNDEYNGFSLIEYAAFFGSIQIFNHLRLEGVELTPSLWPLAIHGQN